jgi:hypothetical protein
MDEILKKFIEAGLPVLPLKPDKKPLLWNHKFLDTELPTINTEGYNVEKCWYGIKTGNLQTKIECLDVDLKVLSTDEEKKEFWKKYIGSIREELKQKLNIETTLLAGYHIPYKCSNPEPSQKLCTLKKYTKAVIETRGTGAYFVCAPTPGYTTVQGDIFNLPFLTDDEVDELKTAARVLNEVPNKEIKKSKTTNIQRIYNSKNFNKVFDLLLLKGWTVFKEHSDRIHFTRPGKTTGVSSTLYKDSGYFYVFTSATEFNPDTAYSPFEIMRDSESKTTQEMEREIVEESGGKYILDVIMEIRKNEDKLKTCQLRENLASIIINDMTKNGRFYRDEVSGYYFYDKKLIRIDLSSDIFYAEMFSLYGIIKTEPDFKYFFEKLKNHAYDQGEQTTIHNYCHNTDRAVYVNNFNGEIWKIEEKDISIIDNGDDGVLFLDTKGIPVKWDSTPIDPYKILFEDVNFEEGEIKIRDYQELFFLWVLSFFFMDDNKPLCLMTGEKGSGKTFLFKKMIYMMTGETDKIKIMPEKISDFWPMVTKNKLTIVDNADTFRDWINDALASCATGGTVSIRKLYTSNDELSIPITSFIGLTAADPKFTRSDIADRLLIFPLTRYELFMGEKGLINKLKPVRNAFMSVIFETLKDCLKAQNKTDMPCITRMADFETFCRKVKPESEKIFKLLTYRQREFSQDSFTDLFYEFCTCQTEYMVEKTAHELFMELTEKSKSLKLFDFKTSAKKIAHKMKEKYDFCVVEKIKLSHGNKSFYRIHISCPLKNSTL